MKRSVLPARSKVQRHSRARDFLRIGRRAVGMGEQRRFLELHDVGDDAVAFFPGVHDMEDVAALGAKPDDVAGRAVALHDADIGALVRLPGIRRLAAHRALHAAGDRQDRKQQMIFGDDEIVHHAGVGRLEAIEPRHRAGGIDRSEGEGGGERPGGVVAEEHHLAGDGIDLGMRGEGPGDAAAIVAVAARCRACRARSRSADGLPPAPAGGRRER